jgi:hypothetical protein
MKLCKMLLAVLGASVLLGALVGSASARSFSNSETSSTATFPLVEFSGGFVVRCNVTLGQRLHARTQGKVLESLIGLITSATVGGCPSGSATILRETLPWHVRYNGFTGTLPNITSIATRVVGSSFRVREPVFGISCLARSTAASPATGVYNREGGGRITSVIIGGRVPTDCAGISGSLNGTSNSISPAVTVTLI